MVTYMDKIVGRLLKRLDEVGVRDNTLVLFTTDNGTDSPIVSRIADGREIAGGKGKTTDAGTHVPLIASWPGHTPNGVVCADLVDFSDFFPTLCAAANVPIPDGLELDGRSFLPQLLGRPGVPREWIYCWYSRNGGPTGAEFARTRRYKLYRTGEFYDIAADRLERRPARATDARCPGDTNKTLAAVGSQPLRHGPARGAPGSAGGWRPGNAVKSAIATTPA